MKFIAVDEISETCWQNLLSDVVVSLLVPRAFWLQTANPAPPNRPPSLSCSRAPLSPSSSNVYQKSTYMDLFAPAPPPSIAAVKSARDLCDKLKARSPDLAADFDKKYDAWKKTWVSNNDSPNSYTRATGPEFDALIALGPKIMPFVVDRLTSGEDFTAVALCMAALKHPRQNQFSKQLTFPTDDKLEANACYILEPEDFLNSKVLQCQSRSGSQLSAHITCLVPANYPINHAARRQRHYQHEL